MQKLIRSTLPVLGVCICMMHAACVAAQTINSRAVDSLRNAYALKMATAASDSLFGSYLREFSYALKAQSVSQDSIRNIYRQVLQAPAQATAGRAFQIIMQAPFFLETNELLGMIPYQRQQEVRLLAKNRMYPPSPATAVQSVSKTPSVPVIRDTCAEIRKTLPVKTGMMFYDNLSSGWIIVTGYNCATKYFSVARRILLSGGKRQTWAVHNTQLALWQFKTMGTSSGTYAVCSACSGKGTVTFETERTYGDNHDVYVSIGNGWYKRNDGVTVRADSEAACSRCMGKGVKAL